MEQEPWSGKHPLRQELRSSWSQVEQEKEIVEQEEEVEQEKEPLAQEPPQCVGPYRWRSFQMALDMGYVDRRVWC